MSNILHFILSFIVIAIMAILVNRDYKNIRVRFIIQLLIIEILLAYFFINSQFGLGIVQKISILFNSLLDFAAEGTRFVFGNMDEYGSTIFFLNILCSIIFISTLIGILQHIHILSFVIYVIGTILSKISGMAKLESFNAVSSLILGQPENFIVYKNILSKISEYRMYTIVATTMSTVSMSIIGIYITMLPPKYVVVALVLNMFSTFIILLLLNPYQVDKEEDLRIFNLRKEQSFFEMLVDYILAGFQVAIVVAAMLIGFIALTSTINALSSMLFNINFQDIFGYIFFPFAWMIGIPITEALQVGSIMATKLISNEFIAIIDLKKVANQLSPKTVGILSVFLVSFANFSSIGIIVGTIKELDRHQGKVVSRYGLKLVYSSTLVSMLSAAITSLVI